MDDGRSKYDLLVVGGGVNGAGVARDAAGRGLRTLLCEQHDLAAHTSSASTKLIHGGLRYLEFYDFRLVRKSLREREIVLGSAPHIVRPMRFVLPHDAHLRPAWMIRAGLFLYDHLARRRRLPGSEGVNLRRHPAGAPLAARYTKGFVYSDAWVDDARLVVITAMDARAHGARILTRTRCTRLERDGNRWLATLLRADGSEMHVEASAVVNATGPWVDRFLDGSTPVPARRHPRIVKGSHIVVPRLFDHDFAYIFQAPDRRIVFAIPYEHLYTLIGTTERDYKDDLATPAIETPEVDYLLAMANRYFQRALARSDVRWSFAGLRPLLADPADVATSVTRDYVLDVEEHGPPLLSIYGGKLTTYRRLAEDVLDKLAAHLGWSRKHWTAAAIAAGRRHGRGRFRRIPGRASQDVPAPARDPARQACSSLRHASRPVAGRGTFNPGTGRGSPARTAPARDRVPAQRGMGGDGRGHPLSSQQAGPAPSGGRSRPTRRLAHTPSAL